MGCYYSGLCLSALLAWHLFAFHARAFVPHLKILADKGELHVAAVFVKPHGWGDAAHWCTWTSRTVSKLIQIYVQAKVTAYDQVSA